MQLPGERPGCEASSSSADALLPAGAYLEEYGEVPMRVMRAASSESGPIGSDGLLDDAPAAALAVHPRPELAFAPGHAVHTAASALPTNRRVVSTAAWVGGAADDDDPVMALDAGGGDNAVGSTGAGGGPSLTWQVLDLVQGAVPVHDDFIRSLRDTAAEATCSACSGAQAASTHCSSTVGSAAGSWDDSLSHADGDARVDEASGALVGSFAEGFASLREHLGGRLF